MIAEIKAIMETEEKELLNWMVPQPNFEGDQDWYMWNVNNWGTKWDICDAYIDESAEEDEITISFSTAWAPPVDAFHTWAAQDGRVQFTLDYWEPGCAFVGSAAYDGDYLDDNYIDGSHDQAAYRQRASADWGYEEWDEEPEPLTEWYKDGVEARGLE